MNWKNVLTHNRAKLQIARPYKFAVLFCGCLLLLVLFLCVRPQRAPNTPDELLTDGRVALSDGQYSIASRCAEQVVRLSPRVPSGWKLLVEASARTGDRDRSIDALKKLMELQPTEAGKLGLQLGRRWMLENRVRQALQALHVAELANPTSPEPFRYQAQIAGVMGRPREVVRCVIELIKRNAFTRDDLIVVTSANPITAQAHRLEQIIKTDPSARLDMLTYVMDAITLNRLEEAKDRLEEITTAQIEDSESQGMLGEIYADARPQEFLEWHARLPVQAESDSLIWLARGKWLRNRGAIDAAIRCLHEALLRQPEMISANFLLGQLLTSAGEAKLGESFTERGKHLQRIIGLSARMNDRRANDWIAPMIDELEATGRLWEAWAWHLIQEQSMPSVVQSNTTSKQRLFHRLSANLPRTHPDFLPGEDFDWSRFPLPRWSEYQSSAEADADPQLTDQAPIIRFVDQVDRSGLDFRFVNSTLTQHGKKIFETMGAGVAVFDYDLDGWPDLYFPQGSTSPNDPSAGPSDALYRNQFGNRFIKVTESAGIHETTYSQGVAAGDIDDDGFPDVYVANLGRNCLQRNNGDGTFSDVTQQAGLKQASWTVSCAIADLNGDGLPELFDVNYVQGPDLFTGTCYDRGNRPGVCRPVVFDPALDTVSINLGDGRFLEQQEECGLILPQGMGLGLVVADFNDDGRMDVFVANDMAANFLLINEQADPGQSLHFRDEAFLRGVALDQNGFAQACMGVACADLNRDELPDLFITNFAREFNTLYVSQPGGFYQDRIRAARLSEPGFEPLGFGTQFFDADHDGWYDLAVANGHIDEIPNEPYQMKTQFFRGRPDGRFDELFAENAGDLFGKQRLGRGMALLDWNRDGRIDFVLTDLDGKALLAENQTESSGNYLRIKLVGTLSSRDAIGAKIRIRVTSTDERVVQLTAGNGYESSNEKMVDVGVGSCSLIKQVDIIWPSGLQETKTNLATNAEWLAIEGRGSWWPITVE